MYVAPTKKTSEGSSTRFGVNLATGNFADFDDLLNEDIKDPFVGREEEISRQNTIGLSGLKSQEKNVLSASDLGLSQISAQSTTNKNFVSAQNRYENEMHLMIDDLDMPNESMTISSLSQSPWIASTSQNSYLSNLNTNRSGIQMRGLGHKDEQENSAIKINDHTAGADELDSGRSPFSGSLEDGPSTGSHMGISQFVSAKDKLRAFNSNAVSTPRSRQDQLPNRTGEDSPDFNRIDIVSVTDDLTVSNTDNDTVSDNNKSTYRGGYFGQQPRGSRDHSDYQTSLPVHGVNVTRNQNRTFADSVLDHHQSKLGQPNKKHITQTTMKNGKTNGINGTMTDESNTPFHHHEFDERQRLSEAESESDISDLELLAQTQLTNNMMTRAVQASQITTTDKDSRSRIFAQLGASSIDHDLLSRSNATSNSVVPATKRSDANMFRRMEDNESLNLTPEKVEISPDSIQFKSDYGLHLNQLQTKQKSAFDRTADSQLMITDRNNSSQNSSQRQDNSSVPITVNPLNDLKNKIKLQSQKQKGTINSTRGKDPELEQALDYTGAGIMDERQALRRQVRDLHQQVEQIGDSKDQALTQNIQLRQKISEIEQGQQPAGGNELLKARALDAARTELREVRQAAEHYRELVEKMQQERLTLEEEFMLQKQQLIEGQNELKLHIDQQKIVNQSVRRDLEQTKQSLSMANQVQTQGQDHLRVQYERQVGEMETIISSLNQKILQMQQQSEEQVHQLNQDQMAMRDQQKEIKSLTQKAEQLNSDLENSRQKSTRLEEEITHIQQQNEERNRMGGFKSDQSERFDSEIKRINEVHQQQIGKLKTEAAKLRQQTADAELKAKTLELQMNSTDVIPHIKSALGVQQDTQILSRIYELTETTKILEEELKLAQNMMANHESEIGKYQAQLDQMKQVEPASQSSAPSTFTRGLLMNKDAEINKLMERLEQTQEKLWTAEQDILKMKSELTQKQDESREMQSEISLMRQQKNKADENVSELKTKLRETLLKQQEQSLKQSQISADFGQTDKQRYDELVMQILSMELVSDPLDDMNLSLQQSFVSDAEQAKVHLCDQQKLVREKIQALEQVNQKLQLEIDEQIGENQRVNILVKNLEQDQLKVRRQLSSQNKEKQYSILEIIEECVRDPEHIDIENGDLCQQIRVKLAPLRQANASPIDQVMHSFASSEFATQTAPLFSEMDDAGQLLAEALVKMVERNDHTLLQQFVNELTKQNCSLSELCHLQNSSNFALKHAACQTYEGFLEQQSSSSNERVLIQKDELIAELTTQLDSLRTNLSKEQERIQSQLDIFKSTIKAEFQQKSELLEQEAHELSLEKHRAIELQADYETKIQDMHHVSSYSSLLKTPRPDTTDKSLNTTEIQAIVEEQKCQICPQTQQHLKEKERELKRAREELDRQHKVHQDRVKIIQAEIETKKGELDEEMADKLAEGKDKLNKQKEKAIEKVRADMRNQMDNVKNELAKSKANWEREKKKLLIDHQEALSGVQRDVEISKDAELVAAREKVERSWRKRLEEREKDFDKQIAQLEQELTELRERHRDDLDKQRQRVESSLTEKIQANLRPQIIQQVTVQIEEQMRRDLQEVVCAHEEQIELLKASHEEEIKHERLQNMPRQLDSPLKQQELLTVANLTHQSSKGMIYNQFEMTGQAPTETEASCHCNEMHDEQITQQERFIEQLKVNFEEELERQQVTFEQQIASQQGAALRILEQLFTLESDKILQCIYFKSQSESNPVMTIESLNAKRQEINGLIKDIIERNDDKKGERQLKKSFETLKKKISEVLAALKAQQDQRVIQKVEAALSNQNEQMRRAHVQSIQIQSLDTVANDPATHHDVSFPMKLLRHVSGKSMKDLNLPPTYQKPSPRLQLAQQALSNQETLDLRIIADAHRSHDKQKNQKRDVVQNMVGVRHSADMHQDDEVVIKDETILTARSQNAEGQWEEISPTPIETGEAGHDMWQRLGPERQNARGAVVVEVEKVARDLTMVLNTVRTAKFCRLLLGTVPQASAEYNEERPLQMEDQKQVVKHYRELLNDFFKLIARLNQASDAMSEESELYKVKLVNVSLRQKINELNNENQGRVTRQSIEEIISFYQQTQPDSDALKESIDALETMSFQMSKLQFKLNQMADLFTTADGTQVNRNVLEVKQKCDQFAHECGFEFFESSMPTAGPRASAAKNKSVVPEMLAPDETAQLIANVCQKIGFSPRGTTLASQNQMTDQSVEQHHYQQTGNPAFFNNLSAYHSQAKSAAGVVQPANEEVLRQAYLICMDNQKALSSVGNNSIEYNSTQMPLQVNQRVHNTMIVHPSDKYQHSREATLQQTHYQPVHQGRPPAPLPKQRLRQNLRQGHGTMPNKQSPPEISHTTSFPQNYLTAHQEGPTQQTIEESAATTLSAHRSGDNFVKRSRSLTNTNHTSNQKTTLERNDYQLKQPPNIATRGLQIPFPGRNQKQQILKTEMGTKAITFSERGEQHYATLSNEYLVAQATNAYGNEPTVTKNKMQQQSSWNQRYTDDEQHNSETQLSDYDGKQDDSFNHQHSLEEPFDELSGKPNHLQQYFTSNMHQQADADEETVELEDEDETDEPVFSTQQTAPQALSSAQQNINTLFKRLQSRVN